MTQLAFEGFSDTPVQRVGLSIGSLFTGCGGLDLAVAEVLGGQVVWTCDDDPAAAKVINARWAPAPNLGDIRNVVWSRVGRVDVLTGGFPCQDVSKAGHRAGMRSDNRSGLWAHMALAIERTNPSHVIIENVKGLLSAKADWDVERCPECLGAGTGKPPLRALGAVLGDLADLGLHARWVVVRASDVGAAHERARVFLVASRGETPPHAQPVPPQEHRDDRGLAGTAAGGYGAHRDEARAGAAGRDRLSDGGPSALSGREWASTVEPTWGPYGPAIARWEAALGRPAPTPAVETRPPRTAAEAKLPAGMRGPLRRHWLITPRFVEWLMGLPDGWVTDVEGLTETQQKTLLGNAVVPQQAAAALRHLIPAQTTGTRLLGAQKRAQRVPAVRWSRYSAKSPVKCDDCMEVLARARGRAPASRVARWRMVTPTGYLLVCSAHMEQRRLDGP